jgi:hypothetical protein
MGVTRAEVSALGAVSGGTGMDCWTVMSRRKLQNFGPRSHWFAGTSRVFHAGGGRLSAHGHIGLQANGLLERESVN